MPSPFPCSPVTRECSWKKTQIEKKKKTVSGWVSISLVKKQTHGRRDIKTFFRNISFFFLMLKKHGRVIEKLRWIFESISHISETNTSTSLSRHEQVCYMRLCFERSFSIIVLLWRKYLWLTLKILPF